MLMKNLEQFTTQSLTAKAMSKVQGGASTTTSTCNGDGSVTERTIYFVDSNNNGLLDFGETITGTVTITYGGRNIKAC